MAFVPRTPPHLLLMQQILRAAGVSDTARVQRLVLECDVQTLPKLYVQSVIFDDDQLAAMADAACSRCDVQPVFVDHVAVDEKGKVTARGKS